MNCCKNCGNKTLNPSFCSRSCAAKYNNNRLGTGKTKTKEPKEDYWELKTLADVRATAGPRSSRYAFLRQHARKVAYDAKDSVCENCAYDKHTHVCHIRDIKDFPAETLVTVVNSIENLVVLCPNCHWEFDNGHLLL